MSAISATLQDAVAVPAEVELNKQHFATKATQALGKISMSFLQTLTSPELRAKTVPAFVATYVKPAETAISELDQRANTFFLKFMEIVYPAIEQYPPHLVNPLFERFAKESGDDQIKKKFIDSLSLPFVKVMIADLDSISPDIINGINAS